MSNNTEKKGYSSGVKSNQAGLLWHLLSKQARSRIASHLTLAELEELNHSFKNYRNLPGHKRRELELRLRREADLNHHPLFYIMILAAIGVGAVTIMLHYYLVPAMPLYLRQQLLTPVLLALLGPLVIAFLPTYRRVALFRFPVDSESWLLTPTTALFLIWILTFIGLEESTPIFRPDPVSFGILLIAALLVPLFEEPLFRELLPGALPQRWIGHLLVALFFAAAHLPSSVGMFILYSFASLALAALRERSGTLVAPIIAHSVANVAILLI